MRPAADDGHTPKRGVPRSLRVRIDVVDCILGRCTTISVGVTCEGSARALIGSGCCITLVLYRLV